MKKRLSIVLALVMLFSIVLSSAASAESIYTVKAGDVLWRISQQYDLDWKDVAKYNEMDNPDLIYVDQQIKIPTDAELKASQGTTITVLSTTDMHGRIYPYDYAIGAEDKDAGLAKIATLVKAERAASDNVILMDLGDTVQDNSAELFNDLPVHPMIQALNYMDYDVWELGNHEFNFEKSFLEKNIDTFNGVTLAANIRNTSDDDYFVNPYTIIEKDGVRVAIIGLAPPHIDTWEAAAPEHFDGLYFTDTAEEARKAIDAIEGQYDVLVGAFHLGQDGEYDYKGAAEVAEACPEFDVIFMGHAHSVVNDVEVNGVKLIEPGKYGWALAKADILVNDGEVKSVTTTNLQTYDVEADPDMLAKFADVHEQSLADSNTIVGQVTEDYIKGVDYITGDAKVTTMPTAQIEDTALIDLINDVQMFYTGADVSSAAAFKTDMNLVAGDFKKKDVANIYKYPNTLMGVNITGANLKAYMEWSASFYNTYQPGDVTVSFDENIRGYNYDMFSGLTYDIDISKPAGERITNALIKGQAIDDEATYKLAVNNYRFGTLLGLGLVTDEDKYYDSYNEMQDAGRIRDLIIKYIKEEKGGVATPSVDNNWKIIGADLDNELSGQILDMVKAGTLTIPTSEDGRTSNVKSLNAYDLIEQGKIEGYDVVNILHTNDAHGFYKYGKYDGMGAAYMATFINEFRAEHPNTLLLDAGDATQGHNFTTLSKGENSIKVMNALKYDLMTVGNHEFDYGQDRLLELADMADFPVLGANIMKDGANFLPSSKTFTVGDVSVSVIGVSTPETLYKTNPTGIVGLTFESPIATYNEVVADRDADVYVALAHLGVIGDSTSMNLADNATEGKLDVIVDGHSHTELASGLLENGVLIGQASSKTKDVGIIRIAVKDGQVAFKDATLFTKNDVTVKDPAMLALVEELDAVNAVITEEVVADAPFELNGEEEFVRTGETNLGNLLATSLKEATGAQLALTNGGGIRTSIDAGPVTKGEVLTVLPFGNTVRVIELTGADVIAAIENGISDYPVAKGAFPHIAGMTVKFDSSLEAGSRVVEILVDGVAIDETATYTLATNDFLVAGGDAYTMFKDKKVVGELSAMDEVLIDYMNEFGFDAAVEDGRIMDVNEEANAALVELDPAA